MKHKIDVSEEKCIGCTLCALTCSIAFGEAFNLTQSYIEIKKDDFNGLTHITFSPLCLNCGQCAAICPTGCLTLKDSTPAASKGGI